MIEVSIPSLERKVDESGKLQKGDRAEGMLGNYSLFRVEILFNGRKHFVLKRHREFVSLHKKLKKILRTPDFPNKRSPHFRQKPLEQRRQELEEYVKIILYENEEVPQEMLDFLQVKHFHSVNKISSSESLDDTHPEAYSCQLLHQRVVGYSRDPYLLDTVSDLSNVIVEGVLQGLYPADMCVSIISSRKPRSPRKGSLSPLPETQRT